MAASSPDQAAAGSRGAPAWLAQLRPAHWIKNVFVLAPALFAGRLLEAPVALTTLAAALAFCALASAVYVVNDLHDREQDRRHPERRLRPLASGRLQPGAALAMAALLVGAGLGLAWGADGLAGNAPLPWLDADAPSAAVDALARPPVGVFVFGLAYLLVNALYTFGLRALAGLDVLALSTLFVLRLLAGAAAVPAEPSVWLLLCGGLLALDLALGKRRVEQLALGARAAGSRPSLAAWSDAGLRRAVLTVSWLTGVAYVVYTVAPRTLGHVGSAALLVTVPLVAFGLWRHQRLVESAVHKDPVELVARDRPLLLAGVLWVVLALLIVRG